MMALFLATGWGIVVLASFAALGRLISGAAHPGGDRHFFLAAGWGMAAMAALGGVLNSLGVATPPVLVVLVLAALFLDLVYEKRRFLGLGELPGSVEQARERRPTARGEWVFPVLFGSLVAFKYVASFGHEFLTKDDKAGYLIQLARLLQTGSIGLDPFSEHQLNSLNGQTFLIALVVASSSLRYAYLFDPGICWIMIGGLTWWIARAEFRGSNRDSCLLACFALMVATPYTQNLGGHLSARSSISR